MQSKGHCYTLHEVLSLIWCNVSGCAIIYFVICWSITALLLFLSFILPCLSLLTSIPYLSCTFVALLRMLCTVPTITANASPLPSTCPCHGPTTAEEHKRKMFCPTFDQGSSYNTTSGASLLPRKVNHLLPSSIGALRRTVLIISSQPSYDKLFLL